MLKRIACTTSVVVAGLMLASPWLLLTAAYLGL